MSNSLRNNLISILLQQGHPVVHGRSSVPVWEGFINATNSVHLEYTEQYILSQTLLNHTARHTAENYTGMKTISVT